MRDGDDSTVFHQTFESVHDQLLRLGVERGGRFVEDEDRRVAQDRAGDADALALPAREGEAALAHHGVVAVRHLRDELIRIGHLRGRDNFRLRRVGPSISDVVTDRAEKEDGVLQNETDLPTQTFEMVIGNVHAVD